METEEQSDNAEIVQKMLHLALKKSSKLSRLLGIFTTTCLLIGIYSLLSLQRGLKSQNKNLLAINDNGEKNNFIIKKQADSLQREYLNKLTILRQESQLMGEPVTNKHLYYRQIIHSKKNVNYVLHPHIDSSTVASIPLLTPAKYYIEIKQKKIDSLFSILSKIDSSKKKLDDSLKKQAVIINDLQSRIDTLANIQSKLIMNISIRKLKKLKLYGLKKSSAN